MGSKVLSGLLDDPEDRSLPALLLVLTVVTGLVDAVSILSLGRVFVANMTGNVVFIGFALVGAPGFSLSASLFALGGFVAGAFIGGLVIGRVGSERRRLLAVATGLEATFMAVAVVVAQTSSVPYTGLVRAAIAALVAAAMGIQNAGARKLAVPDITTTVLTMTLTGIAADIRSANHAAVARRALSVLTMLGGAIAGAALVEHVRPSASLEVALVLIVAVAAVSAGLGRPSGWEQGNLTN